MSYEDYCKVDVVGRGGQFGARGGRQASLANPNPNTNPNTNQVFVKHIWRNARIQRPAAGLGTGGRCFSDAAEAKSFTFIEERFAKPKPKPKLKPDPNPDPNPDPKPKPNPNPWALRWSR